MDEIDLAKRAIRGDEQAQLQLLTLYQDTMYRVAFSYLHNEHDANDALQEMMYQALKNMNKVQSPHYFKTWLVRIVINTSLGIKRKQNGVILTDQIIEQPQQVNELIELNEMISLLTIEQQQLIHLKYFRDLKNSEIAQIQNIPEGTVKSRLHHSLSKLKRIFREGDMS
ncbi:RNA polymerase subunit sigma-24 [Lysinibacillus sp. 2017]|uniref:sigma-70 family RNA polymerase sigma factor n=1 Tax=unclassified Lysinibacillus TaxID=2636778 RepID=UPI000D5270BE|nr:MULTISPECIES: sigma-70 family RNA polymerase sigma factor [unclassified Lysinibacillus]AWE07843.1 RNA polymerase subunit sigma-24 [Lysinibacillus sp. 2017]TGN32264.1 sigma-70 family RNA polymerase sigma factor [Lysinibacillus sp. S2017]